MQTWSHLTLTAQLFPGKSKMSLKHGSSIRVTRVGGGGGGVLNQYLGMGEPLRV